MTLFGLRVLEPLSKRQWRSGILLYLAYIAAIQLSDLLFTAPAIVFPAAGIALGVLFVEGVALWPFVYAASLTGYLITGASPVYLVILPILHVIQAALGAHLLRQLAVDPLFRRLKDMFSMVLVTLVIALIVPTLGNLARNLNYYLYDLPASAVTWGSWYVATIFSILIITPLIMRWCAKPYFSRRPHEWLEIFGVFALLSGICYFLFFTTSVSLGGISLVYVLLIPLFWIALKLRPRFITLGMLVVSAFAIGGVFFGAAAPAPELLGNRIFQTEVFLIILALIFFILSSLEEDRRVTSNLMRSQVDNLKNAIARLSSADRAKTEFIAMLAHELRNPLAPIASSIDVLRLKAGADTERTEVLDLMAERMKTVRRLLDDLLDVSRITENKLSLRKEQTDLIGIVRSALLSTENHFKERHQSLSVDMPRERLVVEVDPVRIEQVVANLLTNASKFSESGEAVALQVRHGSGRAEVVVSDTGVGIEPSMLGRIFEPFLQVEQGERTRKGLGIGLSLVRTLVEMHDGNVRVTSEGQGKGSTFVIALPLLRVEALARAEAAKKEKRRILLPATNASGISVLVVDDNDTAAWGIGKLLELSGCSVDYAYDGGQALKRALLMQPDAILLDIGLPDKDGHEVAAELRTEGYAGILVALTGYNAEERSKESGFDHYLVKPIGLAELRRVLPLSV